MKNKDQIEIVYKNRVSQYLEEKELDCTVWTIKGHAANLIAAWQKGVDVIYKIDNYNAILLNEIQSVRVINT